ncbi:hypothetical protein MHYP_G00220350 [Metynnis hypsauchen]
MDLRVCKRADCTRMCCSAVTPRTLECVQSSCVRVCGRSSGGTVGGVGGGANLPGKFRAGRDARKAARTHTRVHPGKIQRDPHRHPGKITPLWIHTEPGKPLKWEKF